MAYEYELKNLTLTAGEDFSSVGQFRAVTVTDDDACESLAASSNLVVGILQNNPPEGSACEVGYAGVTKAEAGGTVGAGVHVVADADGKVVAAGTGGAGTQVLGLALNGAGADGELISVLLLR